MHSRWRDAHRRFIEEAERLMHREAFEGTNKGLPAEELERVAFQHDMFLPPISTTPLSEPLSP